MHRILLVAALAASMVGGAMAQEAESEKKKVGWFNSTELSLVVTDGNSMTETFGLNNVLTRKWERSELLFKIDSVRSNTDDDRFLLVEPGMTYLPGEEPVIDIEDTSVVHPPKDLDVDKHFVEGRYTRHYKKTRTWNAGGSWDRNKDAGILNRFIVFGGAGNRWRDDDKLRLDTGYGMSFTDREEETPDPEKERSFPGARLTLDLDWGISKSTRLAYELTGNLNLEDVSDYSLDSRGTLSVAMNKWLSLAVSLQFLYNSEPGLEDVDVVAWVELVDPDGVPGSGDEFFQTVSSGGAAIVVREDRTRLEELDMVFRTSLVINF
jgi:hypothetical protein